MKSEVIHFLVNLHLFEFFFTRSYLTIHSWPWQFLKRCAISVFQTDSSIVESRFATAFVQF